MSELISELAKRLVTGRKRDGRCVYDPQAKRELILACREPGVSIAKLARDCGVNTNQLSTWVRKFELAAIKSEATVDSIAAVTQSVFVPVHLDAAGAQRPASDPVPMDMQARLPNGVVVDLRGCDMQQACELIEALGRLRCSVSTKG